MRQTERGFALVEVVAALLVTTLVAGGTAAAVLAARHAEAHAGLRAALDDDALCALADIRAASEYDAALLRRLTGAQATMTRTLPGGATETIGVRIVAAGPASAIAYATATADGERAEERTALYREAPPPGSLVTPAPGR